MTPIKSPEMSDEEKIVYYVIGHALAAETVDFKYMVSESDLPSADVLQALRGLIRRKLVMKVGKEYREV